AFQSRRMPRNRLIWIKKSAAFARRVMPFAMRPATSVSDISLCCVTSHHSLAVEHGTDLTDGLLHHPNPARAIRVIEGQDGVFELVIEVRGVSVGIGGIFVVSNCPPGHAFIPTLDPPPI